MRARDKKAFCVRVADPVVVTGDMVLNVKMLRPFLTVRRSSFSIQAGPAAVGQITTPRYPLSRYRIPSWSSPRKECDGGGHGRIGRI